MNEAGESVAVQNRKANARSAVQHAVRSGKLAQQPCVRCGSEPTEAHHDDYDRPLDVQWLCRPCHNQRHTELKAAVLLGSAPAIPVTDLSFDTPSDIVTLRAHLALSQAAFAETLGVSVRTVRGWEQGELPPGPDKIARMRYLASDRTVRAIGLVETLREAATHFALDGSPGVAAELRRLADNHEAQITR